MNSPFKKESSGSSAPERQQSTGQSSEVLEAGPTAIEQAQLEALKTVAATDGMEWNDDKDVEFLALKKKGLVTFGPKRGPGGEWFRIELTEKGKQTLAKEVNPKDFVASTAAAFQQGVEVQSASQKAALVKADRAAQQQKAELAKFDNISSLDWKALPPPMIAQILINIPFRGASGEPDYYLQPWQAMIFAIRAYELGLSPFSNEIWFNPKNNKTNLSFEGKLKLARMHGLNLSPPVFERIPKEGPLVAFKCTITTPSGPCEYTATLKEWKMPASPVWRDKPEHMLQLRAAEKCLSFATGSGSSELMGEQDLQVGKEVENFIPSFTKEGQ
jgi:hypothetical protein